MAWKKAQDPTYPLGFRYHDPLRCMNCGHHRDEHDPEVGCTVDGGTKTIVSESGERRSACSCEVYVPAPDAVDAVA
jgi:hypothetical protein